MVEYMHRRYDFVTLSTHGHQPFLAAEPAKRAFLEALGECKQQFGLVVVAYVLLDDHVHLLYSGPEGHSQNAVLSHLRGSFTRRWRKVNSLQWAGPVWEKRIEVRSLGDSKSIRAHIDYIHYDPVWHGCAQRAADYPWSSLPARVAQGVYASNWAELATPAAVVKLARMA